MIGLDDIDFAEFTLPPLTTIRLSRAELARAAFEALRLQAEMERIRSYNANSWYQRAWWSAARQPGRELREQTAISALRIDGCHVSWESNAGLLLQSLELTPWRDTRIRREYSVTAFFDDRRSALFRKSLRRC